MRELLFLVLVLACPLLMILMMRGGHGHGGGGHGHADAGERDSTHELRRRRDELDRLIEERERAEVERDLESAAPSGHQSHHAGAGK